MDVSPNALRKETIQVLREVDARTEAVKDDLGLSNLERYQLLIPLVLAKSQCLQTLAMLNEQGKPARGGPRR